MVLAKLPVPRGEFSPQVIDEDIPAFQLDFMPLAVVERDGFDSIVAVEGPR